MKPLTNDQLYKIAPSIYANQAHSGVSDRYKFIPTIQVVEKMREKGWFPVWATECNVRKLSKSGYQKHMIKFRHDNYSTLSDDSLLETVLINSHDRTSAYQLHAGVFRLICSNGMIVANSTLGRISTKHIGFKTDDVIEASYRIVDNIPTITESINTMKKVELNYDDRRKFAEQAIKTRFAKHVPIGPEQALLIRRPDDLSNNLWHVFNRVQENIMRGGMVGLDQNQKSRRIREVKSIDQTLKINRELWNLAVETAKAA